MATPDVRGVPTLVAKQLNRSIYKGLGATPGLAYFRIGEGGFISTVGGVRVPDDPDEGSGYSTRTDVVATTAVMADPGLRYFEKALLPGDLTDDGVSTLVVRCFVDLAEGNWAPRKPTYFELAVFDGNNVMIAYGTFPEEEKDNTRTLLHNMKITF